MPVPCVEVYDWPDLPFRLVSAQGTSAFKNQTPKDNRGIEYLMQWTDRFVSGQKANILFLDIATRVRYERRAEFNGSERITYANKLIILHPRFREAVDLLARCHLDSRQSREPNCGAILGDSGVGKTSVVDHYLRQHPSEETDTCTRQRPCSASPVAPFRFVRSASDETQQHTSDFRGPSTRLPSVLNIGVGWSIAAPAATGRYDPNDRHYLSAAVASRSPMLSQFL